MKFRDNKEKKCMKKRKDIRIYKRKIMKTKNEK